MNAGSPIPERPQLRPIEVSRISHQGSDFFLLKDPRRLSEQSLMVPTPLGPYLQNIDGSKTTDEIIDAALRIGATPVPRETLVELVIRLDEVLLLSNGAYADEMRRRLLGYRSAPSRPPALADRAYPRNPDDLRAYLNGFAFPYMENDSSTGDHLAGSASARQFDGELRAIVFPHIDFERGGDTYAMIWEQVKADIQDVELFVVFGTENNGDGPRLTLTRQNYSTPMGELETDTELVDSIAGILLGDSSISDHPFADELNHASEHSIELAAVWLHRAFDGPRSRPRILPVLCGSLGRTLIDGAPGPDDHPEIAASIEYLRQVATRRRTVFVAAADLAHVGPAFGDPNPVTGDDRLRVQSEDEQLLTAIAKGDQHKFLDQVKISADANKICGLAPIFMALWAANARNGVWSGYQQCQADEEDTSFVSIAGAALYG
ncbi:MAG: AmmeMemoRadiSam system protein B [Chloroflexi bacterium]|nr:AmmeMemoRadiSam system protein B [Chloroflexota bacterium]